MKVKTVYTSELGREFSTAEAAIEDEHRLPRIIATYEADLVRMEAGNLYAGEKPTPELKDQWRHAIKGYKKQWVAAQASWKEMGI